MYNGIGNGIDCERVKMESNGKLGNDGKEKFVGPRKSVRWREKVCGTHDIEKLHFSFPFVNSFSHFLSYKRTLKLSYITLPN